MTRKINRSDFWPDEYLFGKAKAVKQQIESLAPFLTAVTLWCDDHRQALGFKHGETLVVHKKLKPSRGDVILFEYGEKPYRLIGLYVGPAILRPAETIPKREINRIIGVVIPRRPVPPARVA
jgi:hypothetical protein